MSKTYKHRNYHEEIEQVADAPLYSWSNPAERELVRIEADGTIVIAASLTLDEAKWVIEKMASAILWS